MKEKLVVGFLSLLFIASIVVAVMTTLKAPPRPSAKATRGFISGPDGYGVVHISGPIDTTDRFDLSQGFQLGSEGVMARLQWMAKNPRVKAVVLRINSPGGRVAATQEIYDEVQKLRKLKPVVASIADVGASGGYYIACGATEIVALPGSTVGSIGVIAIFPNIQGMLNDKLGIRTEVIKSPKDKMKDAGSPLRAMSDEEKARFQKELDAVYKQFFDVVKLRRSSSILQVAKAKGFDPALSDEQLLEQKLAELAQGQTFIGEEAKAEGLIDDTGNLWKAVSRARKLAKLPDDAPIVTPTTRMDRLLDLLLPPGDQAGAPGAAEVVSKMADRLTSVRIEYLYLPGGILK